MSESKYKLNIPIFDGDVHEAKYMLWRSRIKDHLEEFGGHVYMEREIDRTTTATEKTKALKARNFIKAHLHENLLLKYEGKTAYEIINDLNLNHENKSKRCQFRLRMQLLKKKFDGEDKLETFIIGLEQMFSEFITSGGKLDELDKSAYLLEAMPARFSNVVDLIKTLPDENVSYCFIKSKLINFDKEKRIEQLANKVLITRHDRMTKRKFTGAYRGNNNKEFPRKGNNDRFKRKTRVLKCFGCQKNGHLFRDCWNKKKPYTKPQGHVNYANGIEQPTILMADANDERANEIEIEFCLDSGATHHITNDTELAK